MIRSSVTIRSLLLLFCLTLFGAGAARAQTGCDIELDGTPIEGCIPYTFKVKAKNTSGKEPIHYLWDFGDGNTQNGGHPAMSKTSHVYLSRSAGNPYQVTLVITFLDGSKCTTQLSSKVTVYGLPTAEIVIPSSTNLTQCFQNNGIRNSFKFTHQSQRSDDNKPIVKYTWNFGDGDTSHQENPTHSYDSSGTYVLSLEVEDEEGCYHSVAYPTKIRVLRDIRADMTAIGSQGCRTSVYTLRNLTDTIGMNISSWYWDLEDDGIWDDSTTWTNLNDTVTTDSQIVRLRLVNRLGCTDDITYTLKNTRLKLDVWFNDTICWEDAKKGVQFHAAEIPGVTFYAWNFDDAPDPKNVMPYIWEPVHQFTMNGPKNYSVRFQAQHPICGVLDTCVILHVMGPQATIRLGAPPFVNNYVPTAKKMPAVYFTLLNDGKAAFPAHCASIPYAYFVPVTKTVTKKSYCGVVNNTISQIIYCNFFWQTPYWCDTCRLQSPSADTQYFVSSVTPTLANTTVNLVNDSVEVWAWYNAFDPLPKNPYFRSTGSQRYGPNMHDTNRFTCKMPNLVRFSNFSTKYRLYKKIDDNPVAYTLENKTWDIPSQKVLPPGTHNLSVNLGWPYAHTVEDWSMTVTEQTVINLLVDFPDPPTLNTNGYIDTCVNKNYPYASDSLRYFWDFRDGDATCTSSVNNKNWECQYSILAAPYHYFRKAPARGCATVTLTVYDDVMGCEDEATEQLRQSPPDAWWDRGVNGYDRMTWEVQHQNAFRPATPENEADAFPHLGLKLGIPNQKLNCSGGRYRFTIDAASHLMPTCGAQTYWVVFDSAAVVLDTFCKVGGMKVKYRDYGFIGRGGAPAATAVRGISEGYPVGAPAGFWAQLPWVGDYWWFPGDTGCKTVGLVLQNGTCFDTAWYHDYICFTRLSPHFSVARIDTLFTYQGGDPTSGAITAKTVNYVPVGTSLDPAEGQLGYRNFNVNIPYRLSNRQREREGTDILLLPVDRGMPRVKKFFYYMERREFPNDPFYYHMQRPGDKQRGFWPDSASMNPLRVKPLASDTDLCMLWARTYNKDSVTSIQDTIYYTKYDLDHNLYTIRYDGAGNVTTDTNLIDGTRFFLLPKEYNALKNDGVFYLPYRDMRARPFGWKTPYGAIPINYRTKVAGTVPVEETAFFLDFTDPKKDDAHEYNAGGMRFALHDSVRMHVPFPGFYSVLSQAINADGCDMLAIYHFIHGHFAKFWVKGTADVPVGDSIICVDDTVSFLRQVRYWTTNCPPLPSGVIPEGCVSGPGTFDGTLPVGPDGEQVQLYPWDFPDPVAYRKSLVPKYEESSNFRPETVEWNFGDDKAWYKESITKYREISHKYIKAGIYDVTMRSRDSLGFWVYTSRRNLINVVEVDANFVVNPLRDTHSICAPKNVVFRDQTKLLGSDSVLVYNGKDSILNVFGKFYNIRKVIAPMRNDPSCYEMRDSAYRVDSIIAWTWTSGQAHQPPFTLTEADSVIIDYRSNGQYDVKLGVVTSNVKPTRCDDEELKNKYIRISGPRPSFELLDTVGCVPFTARVRNTSTNSYRYTWYSGDPSGTEVISGTLPKDSIVRLKYLQPGRFRITMIQQDTIFDPVLNRWVECTSPIWPDSILDTIEFWVTVYPFSPLIIGGDTVICPNEPAKYTASSTYGEFIEWEWKTSDGQVYNSTHDKDSTAIFSWAEPGNYWVAVHGRTEKFCETDDTLHIRVDSIRAEFDIDTSNAKVGRFIFTNKSVNGKTYKWTAKDLNNPNRPVRGFDEEKGDMSAKPFEFSDLEPVDEQEASDIKDLTEFRFEICLIAFSPIGCPDTICKEVKFPRAFKPWNVITPDDGDGKNDVFDPHIKGELDYNLQIFNRWGEKVFTSNSSDDDWNGRVNNTGAPVPAGTYYYVWRFKLVGGVEKTINGTVTVLRD